MAASSLYDNDFADVDDYVKEDDAPDTDQDDEDEVEKRVAEEHAKYRDAQAKRLEEVRANRSWSAPPMESPRPEVQRERERARHELAKVDPTEVAAAPRADYQPPAREYLPREQSSSGSLSYMSRPQSAGARPAPRMSGSGVRPSNNLGDIEEEGEESASPTPSTRRAVAANPDPQGPSYFQAPAPQAYRDGDDGEAVAEEVSEAEEEVEDVDNGKDSGVGLGSTLNTRSRPPAVVDVREDESVVEDEEVYDDGEGGAGTPSAQQRRPSGGAYGPAEPLSHGLEDGEEEEEEAVPDEVPSESGTPMAAHGGQPAAVPLPWLPPPAHSLAQRGFVTPMGYDEGSEEQRHPRHPDPTQREQQPSSGRRTPDEQAGAEQEPPADAEEEASAADEDDGGDDGYGDDDFETASESVAASEHPAAAAPAPLREALAAPPPLRLQRLAVAPADEDEEEVDEDEEDRRMYSRAAAERRPPASSQHSSASLLPSTSGAAGGRAAAPAAAAGDLMPPEQFAMQLLRHDLEVLPAHHKARAQAVAARNKGPSAAKSGAAGLAAYGYLGLYASPEGFGTLAAPPKQRATGNGAAGGGSAGRASGDGEAPAAAGGAAGRGPEAVLVPAEADGELSSPVTAAAAAAAGQHEFLGMARTLRGGGGSGSSRAAGGPARAWAPPTEQQLRQRQQRQPSAGRASAGGASQQSGSQLFPEASLSVVDEKEASSRQTRMKYDQWADAFNRRPAEDSASVADTSNSAAPSDRRQRPMTAPSYGRQRPSSAAMPHGGQHNEGPADVNGQQASIYAGGSGGRSYGRGRPLSAQPQHLSAIAETRGAPGMGVTALRPAGAPDHGFTAASSAAWAAPTAAVEVAGGTFSVYVADTVKRIVEANRYLAQLGVGKRYRLKNRLSNMTIELVEPVEQYIDDEEALQYEGAAAAGQQREVGLAVLKELTLKQFLAAHARLKMQVNRLRQAYNGPPPPPPPPHGGVMAPPVTSPIPRRSYGGTSDVAAAGASVLDRRARPASAVAAPSSARAYGYGRSDAPQAGPSPAGAYGSYVPGPAAAVPRPMQRPASARPAYGRTAVAQYGAVQLSTSPPGGSSGAAATGRRAGRPWSAGPGGASPHVSSGGAGGAYTLTVPSVLPRASGGGEYGSKQERARGRSGDGNDDEEEIIIEDDGGDDIDVSKVVRQQLVGAAQYCQSQRREINRLRHMM